MKKVLNILNAQKHDHPRYHLSLVNQWNYKTFPKQLCILYYTIQDVCSYKLDICIKLSMDIWKDLVFSLHTSKFWIPNSPYSCQNLTSLFHSCNCEASLVLVDLHINLQYLFSRYLLNILFLAEMHRIENWTHRSTSDIC